MFDLALLTKNLAKLSAQPNALLALLGLVALLVALLRMRRVELTPRISKPSANPSVAARPRPA